jgi:hypothetical protein
LNRKEALSAAIICIIFGSSIALIGNLSFSKGIQEQNPFLVGVTYCGYNVQDAELLIDKVSNYTNLFVVQSGYTLIGNNSAINEIGDYATSKGLHFAAASAHGITDATWLSNAKQRWGNMFAGVYFDDEPGGKMLDGYANWLVSCGDEDMFVTKYQDGRVTTEETGISRQFYSNGTITVSKTNYTSSTVFSNNNDPSFIATYSVVSNTTTYKSDNIITMSEIIEKKTVKGGLGIVSSEIDSFNRYTMENGSDIIAQVETYQQAKDKNPLRDYNSAAKLYVDQTASFVKGLIKQRNIDDRSFPIFTSDYGLYWWDYQSGYDMILAELGWNNSVTQEIALIRGAANLQDKRWGTILTWKYTHAPYLTDGPEMFEQMKTAYKAGAEYVIVFNYSEDMSGPYGILQEEHFQALERFWNEAVQNPAEVHGDDNAETLLVLPENYGWGMRNPNDVIWGIWEPNATSNQIWTQVQNKLDHYGSKLDIVYEDPKLTVAGKYDDIYFWDKS